MELICKKCGSTAYHKSGHIHGKQRYKCNGHQYTKTTPQGKSERNKIISLVLVLSGLSMMCYSKNHWCVNANSNALDQKDVRQIYNMHTKY